MISLSVELLPRSALLVFPPGCLLCRPPLFASGLLRLRTDALAREPLSPKGTQHPDVPRMCAHPLVRLGSVCSLFFISLALSAVFRAKEQLLSMDQLEAATTTDPARAELWQHWKNWLEHCAPSTTPRRYPSSRRTQSADFNTRILSRQILQPGQPRAHHSRAFNPSTLYPRRSPTSPLSADREAPSCLAPPEKAAQDGGRKHRKCRACVQLPRRLCAAAFGLSA